MRVQVPVRGETGFGRRHRGSASDPKSGVSRGPTGAANPACRATRPGRVEEGRAPSWCGSASPGPGRRRDPGGSSRREDHRPGAGAGGRRGPVPGRDHAQGTQGKAAATVPKSHARPTCVGEKRFAEPGPGSVAGQRGGDAKRRSPVSGSHNIRGAGTSTGASVPLWGAIAVLDHQQTGSRPGTGLRPHSRTSPGLREAPLPARRRGRGRTSFEAEADDPVRMHGSRRDAGARGGKEPHLEEHPGLAWTRRSP